MYKAFVVGIKSGCVVGPVNNWDSAFKAATEMASLCIADSFYIEDSNEWKTYFALENENWVYKKTTHPFYTKY